MFQYPLTGHDTLHATLAANAVSVFLIEKLKAAKNIPWIHQHSSQLNRMVAIATSGLAAVGVHFTFNAGDGTLLITGISMAGIVGAAWHWVQSFALQEVMYQGTVKKNGNGNGGDPVATA